jgi:cell division protein ZapA
MNLTTIKINGVEYALKGNENEEYLHKVARYVDKKIKLIMESNQRLSTSSAAILTAINIVDDLFKAQSANEEMQKIAAKASENEDKLLDEITALKNQLNKLETYNLELQERSSDVDAVAYNTMQESFKRSTDSENYLKNENKELKFQLQNAKNKIIFLQNKVLETQIAVAKAISINQNNKNINQNKKNIK